MSRDLDSELSPDARQVIADCRMFGEPSDADRERVRARWLATVAAGTGLASLSTAARAAGTTGWGVKTAGIALAVAAGAAGLFIARQYSPEAPPKAVPQSPSGSQRVSNGTEAAPQPAAVDRGPLDSVSVGKPVVVEPVREGSQTAPSGVLAAPVEEAAERGRAPELEMVGAARAEGSGASATPAPSGAPVPSAPSRTVTEDARESAAGRNNPRPSSSRSAEPRSSRLSDELALVSEIRASIQQGASERALALLGEYRRRFPSPALGMEADALNVDALCHSGQKEAAQRAVSAFEAAWPASPLQERVRAACP